MNTEEPTPPRPPMVKEVAVKEDGRDLYYYTFLTDTGRDKAPPEDADV